METKIRARMVRIGEKAARVHSDLIRPATQLLYLAGGSECHGGCEYITGLSRSPSQAATASAYRRVFAAAAASLRSTAAQFRSCARRRWIAPDARQRDRKSTRLNSSHVSISYAVFCLKKKKD